MSSLSEHMDAYYLRRILRRYLWCIFSNFFFSLVLSSYSLFNLKIILSSFTNVVS